MHRDVIVIGGSAGGLPALTAIVSRFPPSLKVCVLVVMHSGSDAPGALPDILRRSIPWPVDFAQTGDPIEARRIYVAPSDHHLLVNGQRIGVVKGPRENGFRPAIDPLFRTAARELGPRVIGVVLSGALSDGTYGLNVIKQFGGVAIVQDPDDAVIASMPANAIKYVDVDYVLPASEIAAAIVRVAQSDVPQPGGGDMSRGSKSPEPQRPSEMANVAEMKAKFGPPSGLTCPDCGGALWEIHDGRVVRYQCHVGHQYAPENLEDGQRDVLDEALWGAVRVLEEHAELKSRMARRATQGGLSAVSEGFEAGARDAHDQARRLRQVLFELGNGASAPVSVDEPAASPKPSRTRDTPPQRRSQSQPVRNKRKLRG